MSPARCTRHLLMRSPRGWFCELQSGDKSVRETSYRGGTMTWRVAVALFCLLVWIVVLACSHGIIPAK
jgi:hypothetical protein